MEEKEQIEKMKGAFSKYAESQGFRLNPNNDKVEGVCKGLIANQKKHGARYCPCRMVSGDKEEDRKIICPCIYHKEEVKKDGHCHCGLFVK